MTSIAIPRWAPLQFSAPGVARSIARKAGWTGQEVRMRWTVLIDGETGAYGVVFPDLPGCTALGTTVDEALSPTSPRLCAM